MLSAITLSKRKGKGEGGREKSAIALSTNAHWVLLLAFPFDAVVSSYANVDRH